MRSAIFEGTVFHRREVPVRHEFTQRVALPLLDLDEVDEVCSHHPLWSSQRANAVQFRRSDFYGPPQQPLAEAIRDLVEERTGARPEGSIRMLAHLRTWGWLFNPIACYWCWDAGNSAVQAFVADVTSTPWHGRHAYVLEGPGTERCVDKELHVSPFLSMNQRYRITASVPEDTVTIRVESHSDDGLVLDAGLTGTTQPITRRSLGRLLWRHPMMTARVSARIYAEAARLALKGTPVHRHPRRCTVPGASGGRR
ncbi:MAG TPA: DUF1365 domain-containing protein [Acidimicrobiales bacterium]|nr:DUF1365 domain-containing protein [Acidimicrobiales bacterium]